MSASNTQATMNLANALPPSVGNKAPTSSSLAQIQPFNDASRTAFYMMLDARKRDSRKRITTSEKYRTIRWLTKAVPERLDPKADKKRSWVKTDFFYEDGKLWKRPGNVFTVKREMVSENQIFDKIIGVHNNLGHSGQHATATKVNKKYYEISSQEVYFLVKLCEICHRKTHSKSKDPLKSIVTTRLFERVQINLIDMTSTPNDKYVWICHMKDYFSKFHMLFPITNKEAPTVTRTIHTWISILDIFEILQSNNGSEFKGIYLELMRRYEIKIINNRPRTPRTQGLIEQTNKTVKNKILAWKRDHESTHWANALEIRNPKSHFFVSFLIRFLSSLDCGNQTY